MLEEKWEVSNLMIPIFLRLKEITPGKLPAAILTWPRLTPVLNLCFL